jgi:tetratricopeptide (TPR) repeat protein
VEAATHKKCSANEQFSAGKYHDARENYGKALRYLESLSRRSDDEDDVYHQAKSVRIALLLNLAACHLKEEDYANAVQRCELVLGQEPNSQKALYRRGVAFSNMRKVEEATADLRRVLDMVEPSDDATIRDVRRELKKVKQLVEEEKQRDRNMARRMLG